MKNYRETHKDDHIVFIDLKAYEREREREREKCLLSWHDHMLVILGPNGKLQCYLI